MQKYCPLVRVHWEEPTGESQDTEQDRKGKEKWLLGSLSPKLITRMVRGRALQMKEQLPFDLGKPAVS